MAFKKRELATTGKMAKGSLADVASQNNTSIAETFIMADAVVIVDTSGSMGNPDSRDGQTRYAVAVHELEDLQATLSGKIAVLSFASSCHFCPNGIPHRPTGSTNLTGALGMAKIADIGQMRFILISDGMPDQPESALKIAGTFTNQIDTIYVGPEDRQRPQDYLARLAEASGGMSTTSACVKELSADIQLLLSATA